MPNGDDRERAPYDDNFAETEIFTSGALRDLLSELHREAQLISPKANEEGQGNLLYLGLHTVAVLPYDRNRVRATLLVPQYMPPAPNLTGNIPEGAIGAAQTGGVFVGTADTVRAGGGFFMVPGSSLTVETTAAIMARATVNPTVLSAFIERQGGDVQ